jgi:nucleotide-binding universal stress UspA family protein
MKIETILAGIDFEKDTEKVLAYASYFAGAFGASLKLLHVLDYLTTPPEYLQQYVKEERRLVESKLDLLTKELSASGVKAETGVIVGRLRESFEAAVKTARADMLVVGFVSHLLRRSSSEKLVKGLRIPMCVVRGEKSESARAASLKIKKIICTTDFSDISEKAVRIAVELADKLAASVDILHVFPKNLFAQMKTLQDRSNILKELRAEAEDKLKKVAGASGATAAAVLMEEGDAHEAILSVAAEKDFDLIVMGARGLGRVKGMLIGSVTDAVLKAAPCPVFVIH